MEQELLEKFVNKPANISMAKKILRSEGNENPTSEDIGAFLTEEFRKIPKDERGSDLTRLISGGLKKLKSVLGKKRGGMIDKKTIKKKIKYAGRLAKRGYGKARK